MTSTGRIGLVAALAVGTLALAGWPKAPAAEEMKRTPQLEQLVKAAEAEGVLNVEWGGSNLGQATGAAQLAAALNRAFDAHFEINYTPGPSMPQMATRILQEVKAGQPSSSDVYLGPDEDFPALMQAHVLDSVPWSSYFPSITPAMQTSDHTAVVAFTLFAGFAYNTHLIPENEVPHNFADLFRPEWKGKLASTPYAAGFDLLALAEGDAKVRPLVEKLATWTGGLIRCGEYERLASGEFLGLALDCGQISPAYVVANGGPVKLVQLDDALVTEVIYLSVPKTSAHPNLAKLFSGFLATPEGQLAITPYGATSHLVVGTEAYAKAKSIAARGLKLITYTPDEIAPLLAEDQTYRRAYQRIIQGK